MRRVAELKTKPTKASVSKFIDSIDDERKRKDCKALVAMMTRATGSKPVMWGPAIVGFDEYAYQGSNGITTQWFKIGFSPRKAALSLYLMGGKDQKLLAQLGPNSMGAGCLYIKRLEDVDSAVLEKLIVASVKNLRNVAKRKADGKKDQ
jgi:hypothetical protein